MAELQIGIDPSGAEKGSAAAQAALQALADSATNAIKALDAIGPAANSTGSSLLAMLNPLNLIRGAWSVFSEGASIILGLLNPMNLLNAAVDLVSGAWSLLTSALSAGYSIISGAAELFANFTITLQGIASVVIDVATAIGQTLVAAVSSTYEAFAQATTVAADFQQSMANVKSMGVESEAAFEGMRQAAIQLGADTSLSSSQAAEALYALRSAGLSSAESVAALEGAGRLAEATMAPLAMTAETVAATLRQYGLDASKAGEVSNVFAAAIQNSALTMPRIAEAMKYAGTVAGTLNISLEETTAALMVLNNAGIRGEQSGTVLRSALSKLIDPSKEAADAIKGLGLNMDAVNPSVVGIKGVIEALATSGADTAAIMKIFGVEAGPGMATLIQAGAGAIDGFQQKITGTNAALEMSKTQLDTYAGALKIFEGSWESLQIVIGDVFLPVLKNVYLGMSEAVNAVTSWMQTTGVAKAATEALNGVMAGASTIISAFGAAAGAVGPVLNTVGTGIAGMLTQFGTFATAVGAAVASSQSFQTGVTAIVTAAQGLMAPFSAAVTAFGSFGASLTATNAPGELFKGVVKGIADAIGSGAQTVAAWIESLKPMAESLVAGVANGTLLKDTLTALNDAWVYLTTTVSSVSSVLQSAWTIFTMGVDAVQSIIPALSSAIDEIQRFVTFTKDGLVIDWGGLLKAGVDSAIEIIMALPAAAAEAAAMIGPALAEPLSQLAPNMSAALAANDWARVWGIITESVPAMINEAVDVIVAGVQQLWSKYQGPITQLMDQLKNTVISKLQQMNDEIKSKYGVDFGGILKTFGSVATGVKASVDAIADAGTYYGTLVGEFELQQQGLGDSLSAPWATAAASIVESQPAFAQSLGGYTEIARTAGVDSATAYYDGYASTFSSKAANMDSVMTTTTGEVFAKYPEAAYNWGDSVATSYDQGFGDSLAAATAQADALASWAESIEAHSPPKVGPLKDVDVWGQSIAESFSSSFVSYMSGTGTDSIAASIDFMSKTAFNIMDQTIASINAKAAGLTPSMGSKAPIDLSQSQITQPQGGRQAAPASSTTRSVTNNVTNGINVTMQNMSPAMMAQQLNLELAKRGR